MPTGWTNGSTSVWKFTGSMAYDASVVSDNSGVSGSCFIWADGSFYGTSGQKESLTTDSINMSALTNPELTFYLSSYNPSYTGANGNNTLSVDFYDGSSWHDSIYGFSGYLPTHWNFQVVNLSTYTISGNCLIRFNVTNTSTGSAFYNDIGIDDIRVANQPTCPQPANLSSSATTSSSATLSWTTGGASNWQVEYGAPGYTVGSGTRVAASTNTNFALSGLSPATTYDIYVRDSCSASDQSFWVGPITITTQCVNTLSGLYTINQNAASSATNFQSFSAFATALNTCGVSGAVTVNVVSGSGPYYEQVALTSYANSSSTNAVVINGNGESILDSSGSANYATVLLDGADHITIDSLDIRKYGSSNCVGLQFMNEADSNTLRNCHIEVDEATSSTVIPLTFSGSATSATTSGNNGNYNLIEGNTIKGGYYAIRHYGGGTTSPIVGNQFINNTIQDFYVYGMYNYYTEAGVIRGNDINRLNRGSVSTCYALYCGYTTNNTEISGNWIHDVFAQATGSTSTFYGLYCFSSDATTGNEVKVFNNVFSDNGNGGTHYTVYNNGSDGWWYYHNTVVENDPGASGTGLTRVFYQTGTASNIEFKNNLMYLDRGTTGANYLLYLNATASAIAMDNNAYYVPQAGTGTTNFGYYSGNVTDFTAWQAVNSSAFDQNSFDGDPFFVDAANQDYTPGAAYFNNIGANLLSIVGTDITGTARTTTPDPGAYEFAPPPGPDMSVSNIYDGGASCGTSTDIIVETLNQGTDSVTGYTVNYTVNGTAGTPISVTGLFRTGDYDSVSITGIPISGSALTSVVVSLTAIGPGTDTDPGNNSDSIQLRAGLSGTYTLDAGAAPSSTNFTSFSTLATALNAYGVCGNVTVNVANSATPYYDQFYLNEITGTSSSAQVTINGNGNTLEYLSTDGSARGTVILNGADWVTIDSLNIDALGTSTSEYGFGVSLTNNADHNTISNCTIDVGNNVTSSNYAGLTISGSLSSATTYGQSGNYNTIENNTIIGGYYGVTCQGESTDSANGNVIRNNSIQDYYYYGMYGYYNDHLEVSGNEMYRPNRTSFTSTYFMRFYYGTSVTIEGNKLHDPYMSDDTYTGTMYGLFAYYFDGTASDPSIIANNLLYNLESDGTMYVVYMGYHSNTYITHNTVVLDDQAHTATNTPTTRVLYIPGTISGGAVSNNIVYVNRAGSTPDIVYATQSIDKMDNNAYYAPSGANFNFGYYGGSSIATFSNWQTATGLDEHSQFVDPYFTNMATGNFVPQSAILDGGGEDFTSLVGMDIDGVTRGTPPDIGAYEFTGAPCTGLSQVNTSNVSATAGTVVWASNPSTVTIEWGPTGFKQASIVGTIVNVPMGDTSSVISGLSALTCYDYYLTMNCTSTIPGAPPVMGPYTFCTECSGGPLSGTYTVGGTPGPTNFPTLDSVITTLNGCGINGPVTFNLQGGTHNGFVLGQVDGTSATNTITFNGSAAYGDTVFTANQTAAIDLDGTSHIYFNDLVVQNLSGNYVVWLHNGDENINFSNCHLLGSPSSVSTITGVVVASGSATTTSNSGDHVRGLTIDGCKLVGNGNGVSIYGSGSTSQRGPVTITNNDFEDIYYYGIRIYYMDSILIENNSIPSLRGTSGYGYYLYYNNNLELLNNTAYGVGTYGMYYAYTNYSSSAPSTGYARIINNMVEGNSTYGGGYIYGNRNLEMYHNTLVGHSTYAAYISGPSVTNFDNNDVRNNIFMMDGTGTAMYILTAPSNFTLDYNIYYSGGTIFYNGSSYDTTLADWQVTNSAWNSNSLEGDPIFTGPADFHLLGNLANDTAPSVGVTTDIDGDPRSTTAKVDIGADEYNPASCFPASNLTVASVTNSTATIQWDTIAGAPGYIIDYGPGGFIPGTGTTVSATGNSYTITGLPTTNNLAFQAYVAVDCGGDTSSWAGPINIIHSAPAILCTDDFEPYLDTLIEGQSRLFVGWAGNGGDGEVSTDYAQSGNQSMHIFGSADIVAQLPSYTSGAHSVKFDYYMPTGDGGYYNILHDYTGVTNVWAIEVYIDANGTATVNQGTNGTGVIGTYTVTPGSWNTIEHIIDLDNDTAWINVNGVTTSVRWQWSLGSTNMGDRFNALDFYAAANAGQTPNYYIDDFCVEPYTPPTCVAPTALAASNTNIGCDSVEVSWSSNGSNNSILEYGPLGFTPGSSMGTVVPFVMSPYVITGLTPGTTYQFYVADTCATDTSQVAGPFTFSTPAAPVAQASFTYSLNYVGNTLEVTFDGSGSANADDYSWDFDNGNTGTGSTPPVEIYNLPNTTVNVTLSVTNDCGDSDDTTIAIITRIGLDEPDFAKSLNIYPNPSEGVFNLDFNKPSGGNLSFEIMDASGRVVYEENLGSYGGKYEGSLDLSEYSKGIYLLRINSDLGVVTRRLHKM